LAHLSRPPGRSRGRADTRATCASCRRPQGDRATLLPLLCGVGLAYHGNVHRHLPVAAGYSERAGYGRPRLAPFSPPREAGEAFAVAAGGCVGVAAPVALSPLSSSPAHWATNSSVHPASHSSAVVRGSSSRVTTGPLPRGGVARRRRGHARRRA